MLISKTVTELANAFASPEPTPGGGSAAALAGATGASLLAMVAGLPKTKNNTDEERAALDAARVTLLELQSRLLELVDRDTDAYNLVVAAFRKPKNTPEEKAARTKAIQQAMQVATEVPVDTMEACGQLLVIGRSVASAGNPSAISDLAVALQLAGAGMQGAMLNVEVNLDSVKDQAFVERVIARAKKAMSNMAPGGRHPSPDSGLVELMQKAMRRFGPAQGQMGPSPEQLTAGVTEMLVRLGTPEARKAVEALATSENTSMRDTATRALNRFS